MPAAPSKDVNKTLTRRLQTNWRANHALANSVNAQRQGPGTVFHQSQNGLTSHQDVGGCPIRTPCICSLSNLTLNKEGELVSEHRNIGLCTYLMLGRVGTFSLRCSPVVSLKVELRLFCSTVSGKICSLLIWILIFMCKVQLYEIT